MSHLGFDTSNYTTSAALYRDGQGENVSRPLAVPQDKLGLRQSDALFAHIKQLPLVLDALREKSDLSQLTAVGTSSRPRNVEGSYMPCFFTGQSMARGITAVLNIPVYAFSHQEGHLAAALWSAGRMDLFTRPFLAWHLSGGTTELLEVTPAEQGFQTTCICGSSDLSAGQLIDRTGKRLGFSFPAGRALDAMSEAAEKDLCFPVDIKGNTFSLSGMENQVEVLLNRGEKPSEVARFVLNVLSDVITRVSLAACKSHRGWPLVCSGGVASNRVLRDRLRSCCGAIFAATAFSVDNAMGIAILADRRFNEMAR